MADRQPAARTDLLLSTAALALLVCWEASGWDLRLIRVYGDAGGFAWRDHWLAAALLHDGGRWLAGACLTLLAWDAFRPAGTGPSCAERRYWLAIVIAGLVLIPSLVFVFSRIHRHYQEVRQALSLRNVKPDLAAHPVRTLILIDDVHAETARLVSFAKSLGHPWQAIHIATNPEKAEGMEQRWHERIGEGELTIIPSPYRHLAAPLREYVKELLAQYPDSYIHVVLGHLAMDSFWEQALHQNSAYLFNIALTGLPRVVVTQVPYQIYTETSILPSLLPNGREDK